VIALLPAPWNARTRVHEYGGVSFLPVPSRKGDGGLAAGHDLVFVHHADQVLYRLTAGREPEPLVPQPDRPSGLRWADLSLDSRRARIVAVREIHEGDGTYGTVRRSIVTIPLDGSAATDPSAIRVLATGADFYGSPTLDTAGDRLAYLSWAHPNMPWDATQLRLLTLDDAGASTGDTQLAGGPGISVMGPGFLRRGPDAGSVLAISDEHGWWQPVVIDPVTGSRRFLATDDAEYGGPLWVLGLRIWAELSDGRLVVRRNGSPVLLAGDDAVPLRPDWTALSDIRAAEDRLAVVVGGDTVTPRVCVIGPSADDPARWPAVDLRSAVDPEADIPAAFRPQGREITVGGVHAVLYPPTHPEHRASAGTAPYVMTVHGGPTGQASRTPSGQTAYLTSRGIGVVALDYGGSTGYGRAYRERLNGAWGVVDVQDAATLAAALVADGTASPAGLVIEGGSAGGWTVLSAVTTPGNPFAAGISLYGVADARALADGTHDFESRYTDSLLGSDPDRWYAMSPLARADQLDTPVLLLQGGRDPIVTPDQAEAFRVVCERRGVRHALVIFPDESHGFRAAAAQIATLEAELSFLGQILGFATPDVPHLELR
jgi:dipeptidyl aminopeptidase/acylaminoacyl peptidase